jgi:hypothetical protein
VQIPASQASEVEAATTALKSHTDLVLDVLPGQ